MKKEQVSKEFDLPYGLESSRSFSSSMGLIDSAGKNRGPLKPAFIHPQMLHDTPKSDQAKYSNAKKTFKSLLRFIISNFGMLMLVLLYIIGGAYLFQILEQHTEIQNCQMGQGESTRIVSSYRQKLFNYIYFNITMDPWLPVDNSTIIPSLNTPKDGPDVYNERIIEWLQDFRDEIVNTYSTYKYKGIDCERFSMWNFQSALLFTMTVVSTIGYGHVAPVTWEGQIVIICYATIGIPLFLLTLANISSILGNIFRFVYANIVCFPCTLVIRLQSQKKERKQKEVEEEEEEEEEEGSNQISEKNKYFAEDLWQKKEREANRDKEQIFEGEEQNGEEEEQEVSVPLFIVLGVMGGYIYLGGYLFNQCEGWTVIQGVYFSYVSLSTMGFGDYVPGINLILNGNEVQGATNLLYAVIYIYIGLALLGMSFNLMQAELVEKIKLIATKFGIIKEEEEEKETSGNEASVEFMRMDEQNSKNMAYPVKKNRIENNNNGFDDQKMKGVVEDNVFLQKMPTRLSVKPIQEASDLEDAGYYNSTC